MSSVGTEHLGTEQAANGAAVRAPRAKRARGGCSVPRALQSKQNLVPAVLRVQCRERCPAGCRDCNCWCGEPRSYGARSLAAVSIVQGDTRTGPAAPRLGTPRAALPRPAQKRGSSSCLQPCPRAFPSPANQLTVLSRYML